MYGIIFLIWNILVFGIYAVDKLLAISRHRRIKERTLLLCSLLGGSAGGIAAMMVCHHKTRKSVFWVINLISLCLWCGIIYYAKRSGMI